MNKELQEGTVSSMKKHIALILAFLLLIMTGSGTAEAASIEATVVRINKYGHARLDITEADFTGAGFDLGDIVTVTCGSYVADMPVFNGYYADRGDCMLRVDPNNGSISLCVNYGSFSETAGVDAGDAVTITMKEKDGARTTQEINNLVYSDDISVLWRRESCIVPLPPSITGQTAHTTPTDSFRRRAFRRS